MLVSSPPSCSYSRAFRLTPDCGDDRTLEEATDSAGEVRPLCAGVAERPRAVLSGGRIEDWRFSGTLLPGACPGRGRPDIAKKLIMLVGKKLLC